MKNMTVNPPSTRSRFTLIELLVVIAIIAILASMLLPALNKVRATSRRIACVNQIKNLGLSVQHYINDGGGYLPSVSNTTYKYFWTYKVLGYLGMTKRDRAITTAYGHYKAKSESNWTDAKGPGRFIHAPAGKGKIFYCPSLAQTPVRASDSKYSTISMCYPANQNCSITTYALNWNLTYTYWGSSSSAWNNKVYKKVNGPQYKQLSKILMLMENDQRPIAKDTSLFDYALHNGTVNVVTLDGHVETGGYKRNPGSKNWIINP